MTTITEELLQKLKASTNLESFFEQYENKFLPESLPEYLNQLLNLKELKLSNIAKDSGVGEYTYKIFNGVRFPSRDILISIGFGMKLSLEEMQLLLRISKFAFLDSRDKRDSIIIYCLTHKMDVFTADDMLEKHNMTTLN